MANLLQQGTVGIWVAMAVSFGILSRSWETFFSFLTVAAVFAGAFLIFASTGKRLPDGGQQPGTLSTASVKKTLLCTGGVFFLLLTAERIYVAHGSTYPNFLVNRDLGLATEHGLFALADPECQRRHTVEIYIKAQNRAVLRCGELWLGSETYSATVIRNQ